MVSRERVLLALNHKEPDKVPVDCGGMRSTGFSAKMYYDFKKHLGLQNKGEIKVYDLIQQLVVPEDWFINRYNIDVLDLSRSFSQNENEWYDFILPDGTPVKFPKWIDIKKKGTSWFVIDRDGEPIAEMPINSYFFDQMIFPYYQDATDDFSNLKERIKKIMWVYVADPLWQHADKDNFFDIVQDHAGNMGVESDRAIMAGFGGQLFELGCYIFRNDEFMINLMLERKRMEKMLDKLTEIHCENLSKFIDAIKNRVDVIVMGDDLGTQFAPMIDPEIYKEVFLPRAKKIFDIVKKNSDIKIFFHSCGSIYDFIPYLIEAGVDIINPVQTNAARMDLKKLKTEFGRDVTFWGGGIDTQNTLRNGTTTQVKNEIQRNCEILMKDGGFVFNQVHNMLPGIPPENIEVMYETINKMYY